MIELGRRSFAAVKYAYITGFFALLSGVFYPLITGTPIGPTIVGILVLFLGLIGAYTVYRAAVSAKYTAPLLATGMAIIAITLVLILLVARTI